MKAPHSCSISLTIRNLSFLVFLVAVVIVSPLNYWSQFAAENGQVESTSPRPVNSRAWPSPGRLPQWRPLWQHQWWHVVTYEHFFISLLCSICLSHTLSPSFPIFPYSCFLISSLLNIRMPGQCYSDGQLSLHTIASFVGAYSQAGSRARTCPAGWAVETPYAPVRTNCKFMLFVFRIINRNSLRLTDHICTTMGRFDRCPFVDLDLLTHHNVTLAYRKQFKWPCSNSAHPSTHSFCCGLDLIKTRPCSHKPISATAFGASHRLPYR